MSDAQPDRGEQATGVAASAATRLQRAPASRANRSLIWIVGFAGVAVILAAAVLYGDLTDTPAAARRDASDVAQGRAQTLAEKAKASQLAADQSETQSRALAIVAANDHAAVKRADDKAADAAAADR